MLNPQIKTMTITLDLPQELEQELSVEAGKISLSLPEYILQLLAVRKFFNDFFNRVTCAQKLDYRLHCNPSISNYWSPIANIWMNSYSTFS